MTDTDESNRIDQSIYENRHPSTRHMMLMLDPNPNLQGDQAVVAYIIAKTAVTMANNLDDSAELTHGLRKLLEAKDCFVRASLNLDPVESRDR